MNKSVQEVLKTIRNNYGEAYLVGGCVRDLLLGREPNDFDIATNLLPNEIKKIFPRTVNEAGTKHLTTTVVIDHIPIEITTYRKETSYSDGRHPDDVIPAKTIQEDSARRDFTINAMGSSDGLNVDIDPYGGAEDLSRKLIRCVGKTRDRLDEDKLRALRAVRFASQLNFKLDGGLFKELSKTSLTQISKERIQMELIKILGSDNPEYGFELLRITGLLKQIIPELLEGEDIDGGSHHAEPVYQHNLYTLGAGVKQTKDWRLRLVCLLHDIAKPRCKSENENGIHFYQHENEGAIMAKRIMKRLKFGNSDIDYVAKMIKYHMHTYHKTGEKLSKRTIKNLVRGIGEEKVWDMVILNYCDREGNQAKEYISFKLFVDKYSIWNQWEEIRKQDAALKVTDLKVNGHDIMHQGYKGREIAEILDLMLYKIDINQLKNDRKELLKLAREKRGVIIKEKLE